MKFGIGLISLMLFSVSGYAFDSLEGWYGKGFRQVNEIRTENVLITFKIQMDPDSFEYEGIWYLPQTGSSRRHFHILQREHFFFKRKGGELWYSGELMGTINENEIVIQRRNNQGWWELRITRHPGNTVDLEESGRRESIFGVVNEQARFLNLEPGVTDPGCSDVSSVKLVPRDDLFPRICDDAQN
jgi:hypothetical protein